MRRLKTSGQQKGESIIKEATNKVKEVKKEIRKNLVEEMKNVGESVKENNGRKKIGIEAHN